MMPLLPTGEPADDLEVSRAGDAPTTAHATVTLGPREREDILTREAALVTSARHQLLAGNAEGALHDVRAARALPVRQLEPEVLTLEARALRALGRDDEAVEAEMTQRLRFPSRRF
jgi:Flp pilus assembly protein TadD